MKVLFLLLGTITLAILALPEANATPTPDDESNSLTDKIRDGISGALKKVCAKVCAYLKPVTETVGIRDHIKEKLHQLRELLMKKCNC
ncbi:hypothetical protein HN011_011934 [Eciton burchellii]|jgi:hypothetical protein|nr:hypothetical protein HN011_011934 [Eciton burchellii]